MADFRKWIIVLAALSLFAGLASAQSGLTSFQCNATAAAPPQLRTEGLTELVGDILLTCFGGVPLTPGSPIPTANFTVYMNSTVTSRLLGNGSVSNASEALLMIDDPQSATYAGAPYGQTVPQTFCGLTTSLAGAGPGAGGTNCPEFVGNGGTAGTGTTPATFTQEQAPCTGSGNSQVCTNLGVPVSGAANSTNPGANVFQGVSSGSSVTFYGIPILAPVTSGAFRTYRITNVRINANGIGGGALTPATAQVAITGTAAVPVTNSLLTVGYISTSLATSLRSTSGGSGSSSQRSLLQCNNFGTTTTPAALEQVRFSEVQGSAFKVRGTTTQNLPGQVYTDAESGFVFNPLSATSTATGATNVSGYANWGTRLKATFNNVPNGVSLFVSTTNVSGSTAISYASANSVSSFAVLITDENAPDNGANGGLAPGTTFPLVAQTGTTGGVGYAPLSVSGGTARAVWEVVNSLQNTPENFDFLIYASYVANPGNNLPPAPATMTVNLSYAPTPPSFTAASGAVASNVLGIPRFADTSTATTAMTISICQTALLYPYVINVAGFDTGLSVANTTTDPFGTGPQNGSCLIYWYGTAAPAQGYLGGAGYQTTAPTSSQLIASGTISSWGASTSAPGFSGYVIALCNFQYAHGFAFVSDIGARNLAMGYLALVVDGGDGAPRGAPAPQEWLGN